MHVCNTYTNYIQAWKHVCMYICTNVFRETYMGIGVLSTYTHDRNNCMYTSICMSVYLCILLCIHTYTCM